jgi:hypothetical protein
MIITGLGLGVLMSLFTIIVQNAFSRDMLGQVTSGITFFRALGGSIGVAVIGAIVTNVYTSKLASSVPAPLKPYVNTSQLSNLNGSSHAIDIAGAFAHLGPEAKVLLGQLAINAKEAFVSSVTLSFTIGMFMMIAAMVVAVFLREIPLRGREGPAGAPDSAETGESGNVDVLETTPELVL